MKTTLTGAQLAAALEQQWTGSNAAPPYGTGYNKILQISGFTYQWSAAALAANTSPIVVPGSLKKTDGTPINPTDTFVVAMNNYLLGGGDGFSVFKGGSNQVAGPIDLDALVTYLKAQPAPVSSPIGTHHPRALAWSDSTGRRPSEGRRPAGRRPASCGSRRSGMFTHSLRFRSQRTTCTPLPWLRSHATCDGGPRNDEER